MFVSPTSVCLLIFMIIICSVYLSLTIQPHRPMRERSTTCNCKFPVAPLKKESGRIIFRVKVETELTSSSPVTVV